MFNVYPVDSHTVKLTARMWPISADFDALLGTWQVLDSIAKCAEYSVIDASE